MKCSSRRNCNHPMNSGGGSSSCLNEVQFPKELQRFAPRSVMGAWTGLNEVQFPKELQQVGVVARVGLVVASMKCSSRRNCNAGAVTRAHGGSFRLNEVQFPKELQP